MEKREAAVKISLPGEAGGWKWDGDAKAYGPKEIFAYMDGAGELYLAYNFRDLIVRRFEKPGQPPITLELYDMGSSEDAYGVFSFERQDEEVKIGQGSEFGGGLLRFWKGKYFVSIYPDGEGPEVATAILALGRAVADSIPVTGQAPALLRYLPDGKKGLVEKSIRYLHSHVLLNQRFFISHENILGLKADTGAGLAEVLAGKEKLRLLLIQYPSEDRAKDALESFKKAYMPEARQKDRIHTEDKKWTLVQRRGNMILLVFHASREGDAESLIQAVEEKLKSG